MRIFVRLTMTWIFSLLVMQDQAQITDDFSDGNISVNPAWSGDVGDFTVNTSFELQLNASVAGSSAIHTAIAPGDNAEWKFSYRMEFAPSTSNTLRVYLMLDDANVTIANGYFIEIGENGSEDALHFFRLDGGVPNALGASEGLFGSDPSLANLRITGNSDGTWSLSADLLGGTNYAQLFTVTDATYPVSSGEFFSIECTYTDTRKDKFFFDDVFVGLPAPDVTAPAVVAHQVNDAQHLTVQFNEALDETAALNPSAYSITPGIGSPVSVVFSSGQNDEIELTLGNALQPNAEYTLSITSLEDLAGNVFDTAFTFVFFQVAQPMQYDILINELMPDPSPPLGLPNAEYIELYNSSDEAFNLENYLLTVGSTTEVLPSWVLNSGDYVVLVDAGDVGLFTGIANVLGIDLPSLTNTGTTIELSDDTGVTLHTLSYDVTSYQDASRDDGGWSLELINPLAPCQLTSHLRASIDLTGGTPGRKNSVDNAVADEDGPVLQRVFPLSPTIIELVFDEAVSTDVIVTLQPDHAFLLSSEDNVIELALQTPLQANTLYTVFIQDIADCLGNVRSNQSQTFALPVPAEAGDLFINELLFDPQTGGDRFIEVINVSNKFLDLSAVIIADIQGDTIAAYPIETPFLIYPSAIVAITPDPQDVINRYFSHDADQIIASTLPAFDRTAGNATIYTKSGVVLDVFDYDKSFHNALIDDTQGISLERISTGLQTQSKETWYSASQTAGFGTPGLPNSQRLPNFHGEGIIVVEPEIFSPDNDGEDDFLLIRFPDAPPGTLASIRVFDAQGREVARLAENVSIGVDSALRWDGIDNEGARARIGPYILWFELYDASGNVEHYKRTCVLAERL